MGKRIQSVAVIGAGPAGAIAVDALAKEGVFATVHAFERCHTAGGTWVLRRDPDNLPHISSLRNLLEGRADLPVTVPAKLPVKTTKDENLVSSFLRFSDTGAHENLHSNLPPSIMCFSNESIPDVLSERTLAQFGPNAPFRHREVIRKWVAGIFQRGGYEHLVEYNTTVELVQKKNDEWEVTLRKSEPGTSNDIWWQENFDAVVVATGHYYVPFIPNIPGMVEWEEKFPGRIQHRKHFQRAADYRGKRVVVVGGSVSAFDALHDIRAVSKLPIISSLRKPSQVFGTAPFTHREILNRPTIASFNPETGRITFENDSYVDDVDVVLFATGYDFSFPFLPSIKPQNGRIPGLYQHVFHIDDPSLAFIGMLTGSFALRIFEWQAVAVARVLARRAHLLPSRHDMELWEKQCLEERGDGPAFWALMPDFERYFEDLRAFTVNPGVVTEGRVLPKYDPKWGDTFWQFVSYRIERWQNDARQAAEPCAP